MSTYGTNGAFSPRTSELDEFFSVQLPESEQDAPIVYHFSPNTKPLARFLGFEVSPDSEEVQEIFRRAVPGPSVQTPVRGSLADVMSSPVIPSPQYRSPSDRRITLVSPNGAQRRLSFIDQDPSVQDILDGIEDLDLGDVEIPTMDFNRLSIMPDRRRGPSADVTDLLSPPRPKSSAHSSAAATSSLMAGRFSRTFPPAPPARPSYLSRTTPARNPLADQCFDIPRSHLSPFSSRVSNTLLGVANPGSYAIYGPQPRRAPLARPAILSSNPYEVSSLDAAYGPGQANYYNHLLAATPATSGLDRLAVVLGSDVHIRHNETGEVETLGMWVGQKFVTFAQRKEEPSAVAFTRYGEYLIVGTKKGHVELWHIPEKGEMVLKTWIPIAGLGSEVNAVAYANGRMIAGTRSGMVYEFDTETGKTIAEFKLGNEGVCSLSVSPNGKTVAVGVEEKKEDGNIITRLYLLTPNGNANDAISRFKLVRSSFESLNHSFKIAFSPDGKYLALATGRKKGRLVLMKIENGSCKEIPVHCLSKYEENVDKKERFIFKIFERDEDGELQGYQALGIQWVKVGDNDLIMAMLSSGEVAFIPIDRDTQQMGNPLIRRIHDVSNTDNGQQDGRISYNAYRDGVLYTAAPLEPVPGNYSQSGVIRITKVSEQKKPKKTESLLDQVFR